MPYHPDKRLAHACNRTLREDNQERTGWKSILLLQFQTQFRLTITLGILLGYLLVILQMAIALGYPDAKEIKAENYWSDTKGKWN